MPEEVINELGQRVKVWNFEELQQRLRLRKIYDGTVDLNGKILVVKHTWGLGDILYSTPAMKALKEKFPKCRIIYLCSYPEILEGNPDVDEVYHWAFLGDAAEVSEHLKDQEWYWLDYDVPLKGGYDYKINLRSKPELNERLLQLLRKEATVLSPDEREFLDQAAHSSLVHRYKLVALDTYCWHAFVDPPVKTVYYYPTDAELSFARRFFAPMKASGRKCIVLIPHTSTLYKDYPHWRSVIRKLPLNYHWFILGGGNQNGGGWFSANVTDCLGAFTLRQSAALCIEADFLCSSDTGLLYVRAARGGKGVVTYGPHEPDPFLHYFPQVKGLRIERLEKTPGWEGMCSSGCFIDTAACSRKDNAPPCLQELAPDRVAHAIRQDLEIVT